MSAAPNICPPPPDYYKDDDLLKKMDGGVASDSLIPDESSGRVSASMIASHVQSLIGTGIIKPRPMRTIAGGSKETDTDALKAQDAELHLKLQQEYCYYEQRYRYALKNFLYKATSRNANDNPEAQRLLRDTKTLNIRLNSVLEVMNFLTQDRVAMVNSNTNQTNSANTSVNTKLEKLNKTYKMLNNDNAIIMTQKESVRYTQEKNNYNSNQIALWTALNVVALAGIYYVYKSV
jgi:hypothetical protein